MFWCCNNTKPNNISGNHGYTEFIQQLLATYGLCQVVNSNHWSNVLPVIAWSCHLPTASVMGLLSTPCSHPSLYYISNTISWKATMFWSSCCSGQQCQKIETAGKVEDGDKTMRLSTIIIRCPEWSVLFNSSILLFPKSHLQAMNHNAVTIPVEYLRQKWTPLTILNSQFNVNFAI